MNNREGGQELRTFQRSVQDHRFRNTPLNFAPERNNVPFLKSPGFNWFLMLACVYALGMGWKRVPFFDENFDYFIKSNLEEVQSVVTLNLYGYLIYYVSNVETLSSPWSPFFIVSCVISSLVFPLLGKLPLMSFSISQDSIDDYTTEAWVVVSLVIIIIIAICGYHAYQARNNRRKALHYVVPLLFLPLMLLTMFPPLSPMLNSTQVRIHLHHAFVACICAMFCDQNNKISRISQGTSVGIFISGIVFFGSEDANLFA
jgi:hypothetical protein